MLAVLDSRDLFDGMKESFHSRCEERYERIVEIEQIRKYTSLINKVLSRELKVDDLLLKLCQSLQFATTFPERKKILFEIIDLFREQRQRNKRKAAGSDKTDKGAFKKRKIQ